MELRTITEKDARRLRVLKLLAWMGFVCTAGCDLIQFCGLTHGSDHGSTEDSVRARMNLVRNPHFRFSISATVV